MKSLPDHFYITPSTASTMMDRKDLKELLLTNKNGCIIAKGDLWIIEAKHIVAGVYSVILKKKKDSE